MVEAPGWVRAPLACLMLVTQQTFQQRVDVARVLLDVRVVDGSGTPIAGLTAADFAVRIDGQVAPVETVEWVTPDGDTRINERSTISPHVEPRTAGRWIVFFYQKHPDLSDVEGLMRLRRDFAAFANLLTDRDRVAVVSFDSSLHLWLDFTNDIHRIRRTLEHDILVGAPSPPPFRASPSLTATLPPEVARSTYSVERSLRLLGDALNPLPGAKSIIVLGFGMGTWLPRLQMTTMSDEYSQAVASLLRARASVFSVDVTKADYHPREAGLRLIAEQTGGFYLSSSNFTTAVFERIAGALAGYYALLVVPPDAEKGERQIDVRLVRRRDTVFARQRYLAR